MNDFYDAYMAQFTMGCNCPSCSFNECCSSRNFIYIDYPIKDLQVLAESYRNTKLHVCPCLSPLVINPMLFQDIDNFSEWVKELIDHRNHPDEELSFEAFEQAFANPDIFSFTFMKDDECSYDDFSLDENTIIQFIDECGHQKKHFIKYEDKIFELCMRYCTCQNQSKLHTIRGKLLSFSLYPLIPLKCVYDLFFKAIGDINDYQKTLMFDQIHLYSQYIVKIVSYFQEKLRQISLCVHEKQLGHDDLAPCATIISTIAIILRSNNTVSHNIWANKDFSNLFNAKVVFMRLTHNSISFARLFTFEFKVKLKMAESMHLMDRSMRIHQRPFLMICVRREHILEDTINAFCWRQSEELQEQLNIVFDGEKGEDLGGVSREFFYLAMIKFFSEDFGMFEKIDDGRLFWFRLKCFEIRSFRLIGVLVGLAIHNFLMLPIRFPYTLFKKLLNIPLTLKDLSEIKPEVVQSLEALLAMTKKNGDKSDTDQKFRHSNSNINNENGSDPIAELDLRFEITIDNYGEAENVLLIENGSDIIVTKNNLDFYIERIVQWELVESVEKQFNAFAAGFWDAVGSRIVLDLFFEEEIDILVSGQEVYDWNELREYTQYEDGYEKESENIILFWDIFENCLNEHQKIDFLMFVTGTKRVPIGGLKSLKLIIQKSTDVEKLPVAHTCAGILQLPDYCDREKMLKFILICLDYCEGFGII